MFIFDYIAQICIQISEPLIFFIDNINYEISTRFGFDYFSEYTVFFGMLFYTILTIALLYAVGYCIYWAVTTFYKGVFSKW